MGHHHDQEGEAITTQDIITRVQNELQDSTGETDTDWSDADYILQKLSTLSDDIGIRLQVLDLNYSTREQILGNVRPNTPDLSAYQGSGQPLSQMILPTSVEWRLAGQNQLDWTTVPQVDKVIDTDQNTGIPPATVNSADPTVESWEWRGGVLYVSPCSEPIDMRIRFAATVISLDTNSQQQIIGLTNIYVYKTCQVIEEARSSGMTGLSQTFEKRYDRACADFEQLSIKSQQSKMIRLGGRRSGTGGWGSGFVPPVVG